MLKMLKCISYILVLVGAINWGFVGLFGIDLVAVLFGEMSTISRIVYALVGVSAILSPVTMVMYHKLED